MFVLTPSSILALLLPPQFPRITLLVDPLHCDLVKKESSHVLHEFSRPTQSISFRRASSPTVGREGDSNTAPYLLPKLNHSRFRHLKDSKATTMFLTLSPLAPKSDKHLISPYNITPVSHFKVTRIKEIIAN